MEGQRRDVLHLKDSVLILLSGVIGGHITEKVIGRCLHRATKIGPDVVILDIDSDGGAVNDQEEIIMQIIKWKKDNPTIQLVAYVENAMSAVAYNCYALRKDLCKAWFSNWFHNLL